MVIGVLLTVILVLLGGILFVAYRNKKISGSGKSTPTHSLLARKFAAEQQQASTSSSSQPPYQHAHLQYTPFAKTSLYGYPADMHTNTPATQETIYEEPHQHLYAASGFLSVNRKFSSDPVLSEATIDDDEEDCEEDYAEPAMIVVSNSFNEQIYATTSNATNSTTRPSLKPLPLAHYARPSTPPISARVSPPRYTRPTVGSKAAPKVIAPPPPATFASPSPVSTSTNRCSPMVYPNPGASPSSCSTSTAAGVTTNTGTGNANETSFYASTDLNRMYPEVVLPAAPEEFKRSASIDTVAVCLVEIERGRLRPIEKLGEGQFGEIHVCRLLPVTDDEESRVVAVKSLRLDCGDSARTDFEQEARVLTSLEDPNLVGVLGVCFASDPMWMICEFSDRGDLCQFLQDHVAETTLSKSPGVPTLRYDDMFVN